MTVLLCCSCEWVVGSDLGEDDVAADGAGPDLDVVGAGLGLPGAVEAGADRAGDRGDVGPDGYAGRHADPDVAGRSLGADLAPVRPVDDQVAGAGGERDLPGGLADLEVAGPGLD